MEDIKNLQELDCYEYKVVKNLPENLQILNCRDNQIKILQNLPKTLQRLYCDYNRF